MNKSKLVEEIAARTKVPRRDVATVVDAFMHVVRDSVAGGEKIVLSGFGTFHRKARAERLARDIARREPVRVGATQVPAFRPGEPFKQAVTEAASASGHGKRGRSRRRARRRGVAAAGSGAPRKASP